MLNPLSKNFPSPELFICSAIAAVDVESGAVVAVTLAAADQGDTTTMLATVAEAGEHIAGVAGAIDSESKNSKIEVCGPLEVVADKGCHSNETLVQLESWGVRSYISEPGRGRRRWLGKA